jgi:PAS domain S-box-containing protein
MRLRWYVLALVAVTLVPVALVAALVVSLAHQGDRRELEQALVERARALAVAVDREVDTCVAALEGLATSDHLDSGDLARFYKQAGRAKRAHPQWLSIALMDPSGTQVLNLLRPLGSPLPSMANVDVFKRTVQTRQPAVSDLFMSPTAGQWLLAVNVPVLRDGALRYVLSASMSPAGFASVLASAQMPADALGTIVDRKGIVVAHTGGQERVGKPAGPGEIAIADQIGEGVFPVRTLPGWDAYATYSRVPRSQFAVGLAVPAERLDAPVRRALWWLSGAVVAAFSVSLSLALLAGRRLTQRVAQLAHALRAFGRGETVSDLPRFLVAEMRGVTRALADAMALLESRAAALRESERRYHESFDRSPAGMLLSLGDGSGRILDCNDAFARIVGFESPAEVLATNLGAFYLNPKDRAQLLERVQADGSAVNVEIPIRRRDGQVRWVLISVVRASAHPHAHYETTVIDITEHKQAEELRSIARVANAAAHEINNPLTSVIGRLAMLADEPGLSPEGRSRVAQARVAAERIRTIVLDMHHLTRVEPFEHASPGLPEMIDLRKSAGRPETPPSPGS